MNSESQNLGNSNLSIYEKIAIKRLGLTLSDITDIQDDYYVKYYQDPSLSSILAKMYNEYALRMRQHVRKEAEKIMSDGIVLGEYLYFDENYELAPLLNDVAMQTLDTRSLLKKMSYLQSPKRKTPAMNMTEPQLSAGQSSLGASNTVQSLNSQQMKQEINADVEVIEESGTLQLTQKLKQQYIELLKQLEAERRKLKSEIAAECFIRESLQQRDTTKSPAPKDFNPEEAMKLQEKQDARLARLRGLPALQQQRAVEQEGRRKAAEAAVERQLDTTRRRQIQRYQDRVRLHARRVREIRAAATAAADIEFQKQQQLLNFAAADREALEILRATSQANRIKIQEQTALISAKAAEKKDQINLELEKRAEKVTLKFNNIQNKIQQIENQKMQNILKNAEKLKMAHSKAQTFRENIRDQKYIEQIEQFTLRQKILEHNLENIKSQKEAEERDRKQKEEDKKQKNLQRIYERNCAQHEYQIAMQQKQQAENMKSDHYMNVLRQKRDEISMLRFQMENQRGSQKKQTRELIDVKINELKQISK